MLQALMEYGSRLDSEPGFKTREVRWCIELDVDGRFLNVIPMGDGKRGEMMPRCPDMHGMNSGGKAHFIVETAQTALGLFKTNEDPKKIVSSEGRHSFFVDMVHRASESVSLLAPLANIFVDDARVAEIRQALEQNKTKPTDWLCWRIGGVDPRAMEDTQNWWREWRQSDLDKSSKSQSKSKVDKSMVCFLTGEAVMPLPTHPKITGLSGVGGLGMGDVMVGFDKAAFGSFGLGKSTNAAMSSEAAQQYIDGLNDLIRNHSRKLANALVVHWFKEQVPPEDDPLAWLSSFDSEKQTEAAALVAARRLLDSIRSGKRADLGSNYYYAMTLSGASGRVMVRDWMEGCFEDLVQNVEAWFSNLSVTARDGRGLARDPKFLAVCGGLVRELKDLPAPTTATLWKVAVQRLQIPQPLMAQALARFRVDIIKDEPFNHARMGLIKAYFVRLKKGGDNTMTVYMNPDHPDPAYHCGRLLAILANLQRAALGDVGAGVTQRYYAAASQTPGLVLGRLISNSRNHLAKLEGGLAWWYEEQIAEVMSRFGDAAPRILDLNGQGLFALGYYQQLASLRAGKKNNQNDKENNNE